MMERQFLSVRELASYLGLKESLIYFLVENGKIPHYRIGRLIRFKREDIEKWIEGNRVEVIMEVNKAVHPFRRIDVDNLVKKVIEVEKGNRYNLGSRGIRSNQGLGKEVKNGDI